MKTFARNKLRVRIFEILVSLSAALQSIPTKITYPPFRLMQIGSLFWQSRALYVAAKLGLADIIGDEQKSTRNIAEVLQLNEDHVYRLLRMLQTLGIFEEISAGVFINSRMSGFLRSDNPKNVRAMILMHNSAVMTRPWLEALEESMHDGGVPFKKIHGAELFDYMDQHRDFDLLFSQAMDAVENITGNEFMNDFNWSAFERVIDVGGSKGSKSLAILKSFPGLRAVVFDRPQVIEAAISEWQAKVPEELLARVEFQAGDMFENIPVAMSKKDVFMLCGIFHGMSDEEAGVVLKNLKNAMGEKRAHMLIIDNIAEEKRINQTTASFDMQMLVGTRGRERTMSEWRQLLERDGFEIVEIVKVRTFAKFIVAEPLQN